MNFEKMPNNEKPVVEMTNEQFENLRSTFGKDMEDEEFRNTLDELGITLDSGVVDISVDGESMKMETSKADFGTVLKPAE